MTSETTETTATKQTSEAASGSSDAAGSILYGDANLDGRIDITDAVLLNKIVAGSVSANTQQRLNGDCNGDGALDSGMVSCCCNSGTHYPEHWTRAK
ncbi:MAG: dockerin type I repeat-containing protein [Ruminococcus callidus]